MTYLTLGVNQHTNSQSNVKYDLSIEHFGKELILLMLHVMLYVKTVALSIELLIPYVL